MQALKGRNREKHKTAHPPVIIEFFNWYKKRNETFLLPDISRKDVEKYLKYLFYQKNNSNATRRTRMTAISMFWKFLAYEDIVEQDITAQIPKPRIHKKFIQDFTQQEVLKFFQQVDIYSEKGTRDACILILLAFCGLRVGEIHKLRLNDVVDDGIYVTIQIPDDIGKQGSSRAVDLWKSPSVFIRQWINIRLSYKATGKSKVFVTYRREDRCVGNPMTPKDIDRLVKKLGKAAGIRKHRIHCHMFRATHGSNLRCIKGYDIAAIAGRLGHKYISTTDAYLPGRKRITKYYRNLREYWIEWEKIWTGDSHE